MEDKELRFEQSLMIDGKEFNIFLNGEELKLLEEKVEELNSVQEKILDINKSIRTILKDTSEVLLNKKKDKLKKEWELEKTSLLEELGEINLNYKSTPYSLTRTLYFDNFAEVIDFKKSLASLGWIVEDICEPNGNNKHNYVVVLLRDFKQSDSNRFHNSRIRRSGIDELPLLDLYEGIVSYNYLQFDFVIKKEIN